MKCPGCGRGLQEKALGDLVVDVCATGCGGVWFDRLELQKVDEPHEAAGDALLAIEGDPAVRVDHTQVRLCPSCESTPMMRHFYSVKREVEVDECPRCAGMWLDRGELAVIRKQYGTEKERKKAAEAYFSEILDQELPAMGRESAERLGKARRIARLFRFICPSTYIPGKQKGAAF